ncbi:MAG TPA: LamG-like jellyroll fold domain-containing protein, partial [Vicinamibacterales bacterium]|nr:LamG-like jellyroll fold domain-containing protein [Vicinamibacterales bacterium]
SRCFLYSDGVLVGTDEYVNGMTSFGSSSLNIGGFADFNRLPSTVDDVRLYNTALTEAEVRALADTAPSSSLVGHWKFDEGSNNNAADSSGNGANGTLMNSPSWTSGILGSALTFNGTNRVSIPNQASWTTPSSKYTVAFWVKVNDIRDYAGVVAAGNWGTRALEIMTTANQWSARINTSGDWGCDVVSTTPLGYLQSVDNNFHHVAVVLDTTASRCFLYSDGVLVGTDEYVNGMTAFGSSSLNIGGFADANRLPSTVDDVRFYNTALTEAEIRALATPP